MIGLKRPFKNLPVHVLSRIGLLVLKLAAFRPEDIKDISRINLRDDDIPVILRTIEKIASFDEKKAYAMESFLREEGYLP
jgi:hypothetical protein